MSIFAQFIWFLILNLTQIQELSIKTNYYISYIAFFHLGQDRQEGTIIRKVP